MVRKTKEQNTVPKWARKAKKEYENGGGYQMFGSGIHIHGGALPANELMGLLNASYDKDIKNVGGWVQDEELSTGKTKVYYDPETGKSVVAHRGTTGTFSDWSNNAMYAMGGETLYKTTDRYKQAKQVQKQAEQKYGRDNITTIGHSQGGLQAELLGKKGEETILKEPFLKKYIEDPLVKVCQGDKNTLKTPWVKSGMGVR